MQGVWVQGHGSVARQRCGETKAKEEGMGHGCKGISVMTAAAC